MRSNKELTPREFEVSVAIKRALLYKDDADMVRMYLHKALIELHR